VADLGEQRSAVAAVDVEHGRVDGPGPVDREPPGQNGGQVGFEERAGVVLGLMGAAWHPLVEVCPPPIAGHQGHDLIHGPRLVPGLVGLEGRGGRLKQRPSSGLC
jgi:hypothetical protein